MRYLNTCSVLIMSYKETSLRDASLKHPKQVLKEVVFHLILSQTHKTALKTHIEALKILFFSRGRPPPPRNKRGNTPPLVLSPSCAFASR